MLHFFMGQKRDIYQYHYLQQVQRREAIKSIFQLEDQFWHIKPDKTLAGGEKVVN